MRMKSIVLLTVAMVCGLVAMLGVRQAMSSNQSRSKGHDYAEVLVATKEIPPGTPLSEKKNVKFVKWPKAAVPPGAVTKKEEYEERAVKVRTFPGEIIFRAQLGEKGVFGAAASIPKGMRVISVPVDPTMTNSGLIWPGSRVDVFVTYKARDRKVGTLVATVLEDVEVFAIDSNRDIAEEDADGKPKKARTISLLVTPEEAMRLKRAEEMGHLHVAMRGADDDSHVHTALRFDQVNAPFEPQNVESDVSAASTDGKDLMAFLNEIAGAGNAKGTQKEEGAETDKADNVWKIRIYSGNNERVEEVPLNEPEQTNEAFSDGRSAAVSGEEVNNPLLSYLKRVLTP